MPTDMDVDKLREALRRAFQSRVVEAAETMGYGKQEFGDAVMALPAVVYNAIVDSFRDQAEEIRRGEKDV